jgi:hypothetical protein
VVDPGGDFDGWAEVAAHENDPGGRRGRSEVQSHIRTSQQPYARQFRRPGDRPLVAVALFSHLLVFLGRKS